MAASDNILDKSLSQPAPCKARDADDGGGGGLMAMPAACAAPPALAPECNREGWAELVLGGKDRRSATWAGAAAEGAGAARLSPLACERLDLRELVLSLLPLLLCLSFLRRDEDPFFLVWSSPGEAGAVAEATAAAAVAVAAVCICSCVQCFQGKERTKQASAL